MHGAAGYSVLFYWEVVVKRLHSVFLLMCGLLMAGEANAAVVTGSGTLSTTAITQTTISVAGSIVTNNVGPATTLYGGFSLSAFVSPNESNSFVSNVPGTLSLTATITGLTCGTSYQVYIAYDDAGSIINAGTPPVSPQTVVTSACAYTIGGTISGLTGSGLVLGDVHAGSSPITSGATSFTLPNGLAASSSYAVTVQTQPTGQTCTVSNGSGSVASANITNISVTCANNPAPAQPIPTLSEWAQILMMLMMIATAGFYGWRMKQR